MSGSQRRRPWNLSFTAFMRRFLLFRSSSSSSSVTASTPAAGQQQQEQTSSQTLQQALCRHPVYRHWSFSTLNHGWMEKQPVADAGKRIGHVSVCCDGKLVVWGGYNDERLHRNFPTNELWVYDPIVNKWSLWHCIEKSGPGRDLPPGTSGATSCMIGRHMYIFGGYTFSGNVNTLFRIDLKPLFMPQITKDISGCNQLVSMEKLTPDNSSDGPYQCDKCVSWTYDNKLYVFGGYGYEPQMPERYPRITPYQSYFLPDQHSQSTGTTRRGWNNQLACYDPQENKWSYPKVKGNWPSPRAAHAAAVLDDKVFLFGGRHDSRRLNDLWVLDMEQMTWTEISCEQMPAGRSWHSFTAVSDDEVLLYGGLSNDRQPLADCFIYNVKLNKWLTVSIRPEPRLWHSAVFSPGDQQVFIYGGGTDDILDHSVNKSELYSNDLITIRFTPDSLVKLCLDACSSHVKELKTQYEDLPKSLGNILKIRTSCSLMTGPRNSGS